MKTPLTILKGQIENMILGYGDYQNHEKYLPETLKATEDIEHLVKEIIAISKMESMDLEDTLREVSLKQTVNDTIQAILPLAQDKDIQIHQNISTDMVLSVNPNLGLKPCLTLSGTLFGILLAAKMCSYPCNPVKMEILSLSKILERLFQRLTFLICSHLFIGQTNRGIRLLEEAVWGYTLSKQFLTYTV